MENNLHLTLIQSNLHWHDPAANLAMFEEKIWKITQKTDLIILPEMFTTGFTMAAAEMAEPMNLHTFKWLKQMAAQTGAVITGSYIVKEGSNYFNRLVWMEPDGQYSFYDKRHLFRMAEEHQTYSAGQSKIIQNLKGWRIMPLICYDLRFPVWSRNVDLAYDLIIYVANWPQARNNAWKTLLQARAIENLSYCVGVNRIGTDGKGIYYSGDSAVIDFKGQHFFQKADEECIESIVLDKLELMEFRQKFPANLDADSFEII
jgi:predicted amidohydrolase